MSKCFLFYHFSSEPWCLQYFAHFISSLIFAKGSERTFPKNPHCSLERFCFHSRLEMPSYLNYRQYLLRYDVCLCHWLFLRIQPPSPWVCTHSFPLSVCNFPFWCAALMLQSQVWRTTDDCCKQTRITSVFALFTLSSPPTIKQFASWVDKSNVSTLQTQERLHLFFYSCARHLFAKSIHLVLPQP